MTTPLTDILDLSRADRTKTALLSGWFFLVITTLRLLEPIRHDVHPAAT